MLKVATSNTVILGLTRQNVERLMKGDNHVMVDGNELGIPGKSIAIVYGETEDDIARALGFPEEDIAVAAANRGQNIAKMHPFVPKDGKDVN